MADATPELRWRRAILHVDMDAFYVAVEQRRDPSLLRRPVVVGGTGRRGVVASASYEARAFGVRSAMPTAHARRLCPQAVFLDGDHARYGEASRRVMAIFERFTPLVEPLSLDEAFLDVTGAQTRLGDPPTIAAAIRATIAQEQHLPASVGVAPTKFLAKLASEAAKPTATPRGPRPGAGVFVVPEGGELAFLHPLPVRALWGVGPATLKRLERFGITTVGELAGLPLDALIGAVGDAHGRHLHRLAQGIDDRDVEVGRATKSIGHEETFPFDRSDRDGLEAELVRLADGVAMRLRRAGLAGRTVTLKLRYGDFRTLTRSRTVAVPVDDTAAIAREARALLHALDLGPGIRLLGVSVSGLVEPDAQQLTLDLLGTDDGRGGAAAAETTNRPARDAAWREAHDTIDAIRARFGDAVIGPAVLSSGGRLRVLRRGEAAWGPTDPAGGLDPAADREIEPRPGPARETTPEPGNASGSSAAPRPSPRSGNRAFGGADDDRERRRRR